MNRRTLALSVCAFVILVADEAAIPIGVNLMANILLDHQLKSAKKGTQK